MLGTFDYQQFPLLQITGAHFCSGLFTNSSNDVLFNDSLCTMKNIRQASTVRIVSALKKSNHGEWVLIIGGLVCIPACSLVGNVHVPHVSLVCGWPGSIPAFGFSHTPPPLTPGSKSRVSKSSQKCIYFIQQTNPRKPLILCWGISSNLCRYLSIRDVNLPLCEKLIRRTFWGSQTQSCFLINSDITKVSAVGFLLIPVMWHESARCDLTNSGYSAFLFLIIIFSSQCPPNQTGVRGPITAGTTHMDSPAETLDSPDLTSVIGQIHPAKVSAGTSTGQ